MQLSDQQLISYLVQAGFGAGKPILNEPHLLTPLHLAYCIVWAESSARTDVDVNTGCRSIGLFQICVSNDADAARLKNPLTNCKVAYARYKSANGVPGASFKFYAWCTAYGHPPGQCGGHASNSSYLAVVPPFTDGGHQYSGTPSYFKFVQQAYDAVSKYQRAGNSTTGNALAASGYKNPLRDLQDPSGGGGGRIDEGVDYYGHGPIYAIGPGNVVVYDPIGSDTGWTGPVGQAHRGAFIAYQLTSGPAKGLFVYLAENVTLAGLSVGDTVNENTVVGHLQAGYPHCEFGWAAASVHEGAGGHTAAAASDNPYPKLGATDGYTYNEADQTAFGADFDQFITLLGGPAASKTKAPIHGTLPAGWPNWSKKGLRQSPYILAAYIDTISPPKDLLPANFKAAMRDQVRIFWLLATYGLLQDGRYLAYANNADMANARFGAVHQLSADNGADQADNFWNIINSSPHAPRYVALEWEIPWRDDAFGSDDTAARFLDRLAANMLGAGLGKLPIVVYGSTKFFHEHPGFADWKNVDGLWVRGYTRTSVPPSSTKRSTKGTSPPPLVMWEYTDGHKQATNTKPHRVRGVSPTRLSEIEPAGYSLFGINPNTGCFKTASSSGGGATSGNKITYSRSAFASAVLKDMNLSSGTKTQITNRVDALLAWMQAVDDGRQTGFVPRFNPLYLTRADVVPFAPSGDPTTVGFPLGHDKSNDVWDFNVWVDAAGYTAEYLLEFGRIAGGEKAKLWKDFNDKLRRATVLEDILTEADRVAQLHLESFAAAGYQNRNLGVGTGKRGGYFGGPADGVAGGGSGGGCVKNTGPSGHTTIAPPLVATYDLRELPKTKFHIKDDFAATLYDSHMMDVEVRLFDQDEKKLAKLTRSLRHFGVTAGQVDVDLSQPIPRQLSLDLTVKPPRTAGDFEHNVWGISGGEVDEKGAWHPAHFVEVFYRVYVDRPKGTKFPSGLPARGKTDEGDEPCWVGVPVFYGPVTFVQADQTQGTLHIEAQDKSVLLNPPNTRHWSNAVDQFGPTVPYRATVADMIKLVARQFGETKFRLPKSTPVLQSKRKAVERFVKQHGPWAWMQKLARGVGYALFYSTDGHLTMKKLPLFSSHVSATVALSSHPRDDVPDAPPSCLATLPQVAFDASNWYNTVAMYAPYYKGSKAVARAVIYESDDDRGSKLDLARNGRQRFMTLFVDSPVALPKKLAISEGKRHLQAAFDQAQQIQVDSLPFPTLDMFDRVGLWIANIDGSEHRETVIVPQKWTLPLVPTTLMSIGFNAMPRVTTSTVRPRPAYRRGT